MSERAVPEAMNLQQDAASVERGRDPFELYMDSLFSGPVCGDEAMQGLAGALNADEIELYGQLIVSVKDPDATPMCQVLVRLREEETSLLPPGEFLPIFEHYGMLPALDRWVASRVCRWYASEARSPGFACSMSLSSATIDDGQFPQFVRDIVAHHAMPAGALCFELAEADLTARLPGAAGFVAELKAAGAQVSLGSFGTRLEALVALKMTAPDLVQFNGSFARDIERDPLALSRLEVMLDICHCMGSRTIVEQVESWSIFWNLHDLGVDFAQGFGLSVPVPIGEMDRT